MSSTQPTKPTGSAAVSSPAGADDLQENLRRLDRLANLGLFSAGSAHEIKNGLVAIKTYVEVRLAISRRVAEEHQGSIEVTSQPGHGAVFILTLPAE